MKTRITMRQIYGEVAAIFKDRGELAPTHCDVRCMVNDYQNWQIQDGAEVHLGYSQDEAFRAVRRLLGNPI